MSIQKMPRYEAYKDSGVEWIGEIPEHWNLTRVLNVSNVIDPQPDHRAPALDLDGMPYIGIRDINVDGTINLKTARIVNKNAIEKQEASFSINDGDIIFCKIGTLAHPKFIQLSKQRIALSATLVLIKSKSSIHNKYLKYCLDSDYILQSIKRIITGATRPALGIQQIRKFAITFPLFREQTTIAHFLDQKTTQIDQAIHLKEKQITLLKERQKILIQHAVTHGLNPNAPLRDSGVEWIGEIPEHWHIRPNFFLFTERVESGYEGLPLLMVSIHSGVSEDEVSAENNIRGRIKIADKSKYNLVEPHDIVFNMMRAWQGGIGAVKNKGMVSPAYIIATPNDNIDTRYFEYQYRSPLFIQQMDRFSKGITDFRKRLYWDEFKRLNTVVPPIKEQKRIVTYIEIQSKKTNKAITLYQQQINKLKEYKVTLINSAVTGKIKVPREFANE